MFLFALILKEDRVKCGVLKGSIKTESQGKPARKCLACDNTYTGTETATAEQVLMDAECAEVKPIPVVDHSQPVVVAARRPAGW